MDLMKQTKIENEAIIEKIKRGGSTYFLDHKRIESLEYILKKCKLSYQVFYPYKGATYGVIYTETPKVSLLKIVTNALLTHSLIMGSLFSLNIKREVLGDIIISNSYYVVVLGHMASYIMNNLYQIGRNSVTIELSSFDEIKDYEPIYETYTVSVSSERIDVVISKILGLSRNAIDEKFKNKEVILNYNIQEKSNAIIKVGDVFSVRRYGKYKYLGVTGTNKKDKLIISYQKYVA